MWRFWTCVFICFLVECRRIHEPINDNYKKASKKDISESTKDQKTEEGFDLGNCTDCKEENQKLTETKAPISSNDLDSKKTKKSDSPSSENAGRKGNAAPSGRKRNPNKKEVKRKSRNRKHKKNRKSNPRHKPENLLSDPTDNSSQDRWGRQKLKQLPEVARLEQRLHPTVKNPIHNMVTSMDRILRTLQYTVRRVDGDYHYMFNATRYNIMMTVREELMNIAKENDKAYDAVLQASLLTKDIYRRAHERHLLGPRTIPAAVSSKTMPKLRHLRLRDDYILAREELQKAERLKHTIARAERKRYDLQSGLMKVQRQVEEKLPARALTDLIRISNQTLRVLETTFSAMDVDGRAPLYGLMHRNGMENLREARDLSYSAKHILSQAKTQILIGRNFRNQIQQRVRERTPDTRGDMPFDETRMMLWAVVDSARIHAEKLFKTAANIHMKLKPILKKAREVLADKDKGTLSRKVEEKTRELRAQIKDLQRTLDKIRVKIGNEDILRARCEELQTSANWFNTDTIIDCDAYIITEGSGIDIDTDGSGDLVDEKIDIEIPRRVKAESIDKVSMSETKSNKTGVAKGKTAEEEDVTFSKGTIRKTGVTSTTDDEDMVLKKSKPETTTVAMTSTVETVEDVSENDDFTFVDWFGLLADDPMTELVHSDIHGNQPSLNELILDQLALYSKTSKAVLSNTDKTKEGLEDLQMKWNETKMAYKRFENNVLSTKVFLHGWAAKKAYVDSVHDRVMSLGDTIDLQSTLIENQCSVAVGVAEKKLEQAEERRDKNSETAGTAADPEDVKAAKESVTEVKEHVKEILQLKQIHPDPCSVIQNIDSTLKTNISELRKKIEQAKLITSTLQLPVSLQSSGYLTLPLDHDDKTKLSRMSLAMSLKSNISDGSVAVVKTKETGSLVISVKNSAPVLTVLDKDDYNVGELTSDMLLEEDTTYRIFAERLGSLFNFFVYNTGNENLDTNDSMLIDSVAPYQLQPSVVYVAGAPEDSPTFASESWQGCLSQFSVNGRYLNLFQKDSDGNLPEACPNLRSVQLDESLVLGGSGYAKLGLEPLSSLSRGTMDDMKIKFKAYTDGVIVHIESTSRRAFELVQIENGRIVVSFKNYYGQTTLQSKQDTFKYSVYQDLQIKVKPGRQPKLEVLLDGDTEAFESRQQSSDIQDVSETSLFIGGLPKLQNSSLSGCIKSLLINEKELSFSTVETSYDVNYGVCEEGNCVKFIESSHPVDIGEDKGRNSLMMSFTYGSVGNILEYSKGEKFSITVTLDTEGLDIYEAVGEVSEQIYLETFKEGSMVTVNIESSSKEVEIKVDKVAKAIPYESGSVWGGLFSDEKDEKYKIIVGGSSDNEDNFKGTLIDLFMNGRPFDTSKYLESNNLVSCTPPRAKRRPLTKEQEVQTFTCEEQNL